MKITSFDRKNIESICSDIDSALKTVGEKYGVSLSTKGGTFSPDEFRTKLICKTSEATNPKKDFENKASLLGLDASILNTTFVSNGATYTVVDLAPSSHKYPVIGESAKGTKYKFSLDVLKKKSGKKRSDKEIIKDICDVYGGLSPENLCCDGELPRYLVVKKERELNRELKGLFVELGREVDETSAYKEAGIF